MTRARAVELLKGIQFCCDFDDCTNAWDCDECVEAFNMAIEALEPKEIPFTEWIVGFTKKYFQQEQNCVKCKHYFFCR